MTRTQGPPHAGRDADPERRGRRERHPPPAVEARLRSLDAGALASLVADLYAARGFETTREGRMVIAERPAGAVTVAVAPAGVRESAPPADPPPDVVVAPAGLRSPPPGARVLEAADLGEMLWYAVERPTAVALCERHLGGHPAALRAPLPTRLRALIRRVDLGAALPVAAALLAAAALVAAAGPVASGAGLGGLFPVAGLGGSSPAGAESGGTAAEAAAGTPPGEGPAGVARDWTGLDAPRTPPPDLVVIAPADGVDGPAPGVGPTRVRNLTALAAAHAETLAGRSYRLRTATNRSWGDGVDGLRVHRVTDVAVARDRYLLETTVAVGGDRHRRRAVYHDGDDWFLADGPVGAASYRRFDSPGPIVGPTPGDLRRGPVVRYLSTPTTRVSDPVARGNGTAVRVVGTGTPTAPGFDGVRDYTVRALVTEAGLVVNLTATFEATVRDGHVRIRVSWTYAGLDRTTVTPPEWYEREFPAAAE